MYVRSAARLAGRQGGRDVGTLTFSVGIRAPNTESNLVRRRVHHAARLGYPSKHAHKPFPSRSDLMSTPLFLALATMLVGSLLAIVAIGTSLEEPRPDPPLDPGIGPRDERDNLLPT